MSGFLLGKNVNVGRIGSLACIGAGILALGTGCMPPGGILIRPAPADQTIREQVIYKASSVFTSDRIAVIDIGGVLTNMRDSSFLGGQGEQPVSFALEKLSAAENDKRVKAVVLRVNSPGGTVTASDILYQEILGFKKRSKKPVVAFFMDVAASGAYYLSCAADEIVAQRSTVTGSIGVIMQLAEFSGTMSKLGITADAITSGPHKDTGSPFRKMRPEERELFQGLVDGFYKNFISVVEAGRPKLSHEAVLKLADGRVYIAEQALEAGLIDKIGTIQDAIADAKSQAGIKDAHVLLYHRPVAWAPNAYAQAPGLPATVNLLNVNLPKIWTGTPEFLYIWGASN